MRRISVARRRRRVWAQAGRADAGFESHLRLTGLQRSPLFDPACFGMQLGTKKSLISLYTSPWSEREGHGG